jgi:hypothetical protein
VTSCARAIQIVFAAIGRNERIGRCEDVLG